MQNWVFKTTSDVLLIHFLHEVKCKNNILSFNFRVPEDLKDEVESYFKRFKLGEPILVDIGGTGDMRCEFKGISPVIKSKDKMDYYFLSVTLQEDKQYNPLEEEKCETCSGCGFH